MFISIDLPSPSTEAITFVKQIGIEYVDLHQRIIPGYQKGALRGFQKFNFKQDKDKVLGVIRRVKESDLKINSFIVPPIREASFSKPEGDKQVDDVCNFIRLLGEESVPLAGIGIQDVRNGPTGVPGRYSKEHRGGYRMDAFSLNLMREELEKRNMDAPWSHNFKEKLTYDEYFSNCVEVLKKIIPIAEESNVKLMTHLDDPPLQDEKLLPGITNPLQINRLFEKVPSKNFGLLFCCGTRYESGVDIYKQIRVFGMRKKIFLVHFRNVRGTIPSEGEYEEVMLDDGDMDMLRVLEALEEVGYDGAINPDHLPEFIGDKDNKAGLAYSVAYMKGLLSSLNP